MKKVRVSLERCIGAGNCVGVAPRVFQLNSLRQAEAFDPTGADDQTLRDAAESCPTDAILLFDDDGHQIYPPPDEAAPA